METPQLTTEDAVLPQPI